jgi:hypothetical protein
MKNGPSASGAMGEALEEGQLPFPAPCEDPSSAVAIFRFPEAENLGSMCDSKFKVPEVSRRWSGIFRFWGSGGEHGSPAHHTGLKRA